MGEKRDSRRGWWAALLFIGAAIVCIVVWLIPEILKEDSGRDRGFVAAGAAFNPKLDSTRTEADPEEKESKKAAAKPEAVVEELPAYGDKELARDKSIRGRVVDKEGKIVADAIVVAAYKDNESYPREIIIVSKVRSEEDGSFVLGPLGRRQFWIVALKKEVGIGFVSGKMPGAWVEIALSEGASVRGKVTEFESGKPVVGATVSVSDWTFWTDTKTDEEGNYVLAPVPPTVNMWSANRVMVVAEGFQRAERNNLILKNGADETVDFRLGGGEVLAGKVLDAQNLQPIKGAIVAEGWESYHQNATSDEQGAFSLPHVDVAPNRMFTVRAEGYLPQQRQSDGTGKLEFKMSKSEMLEGTVVNPKDEPVAGARVYLHRIKYAPGHTRSGGGSGRWRMMTETDETGKFQFKEVLPGQVACVAFDKDFAPGESQPIDIQLGAPPPSDIKVTLKQGASVEGEVRDTSDNPIPGIQVTLQRWGFRAKGYKYVNRYIWYENPSWYSDENGKFVLKGAIAGQLYLSVWDRNYGWTAKQIKAEDGQHIPGVILSFAGEAIEGVFLDSEGAPVPGAWLYAQGPKNTQKREWRWTSTDALGRFKLAGLKAGSYDINGSFNNSQAEPLKDIPAGTTGVELKLKPTQLLRGTVTSVLTGRALTQYRIQFNPQKDANGRSRGGTSWGGEIKSPDGKFERPVKEGVYTAVVKARGHAPFVVRDIVVEKHVPPQELYFQLDQGGGIKGVIRGIDGKPLRGVYLNAQVNRAPGEKREAFDYMMGGSDGTDSEGRYFIEGVAPGSYRIQVSMGNRGSAVAIVNVSGSESVQQDLQLVPGGYLQFSVTDEDGKPLKGAYFQIRDANGGYIGWARRSDANGISKTGQLRSGPAEVTAHLSRHQQEKFAVTIVSSKTTTINVIMRKIAPKPANR